MASPKIKRPKLTPKERRFCYFYAKTRSAPDAVRMAGYDTKDKARQIGWRMLRKEHIRDEIKSIMWHIDQSLSISKEWGQMHLKAIAQNPNNDIHARVAALRELAKWQGWTEPDSININVGNMDDEMKAVLDDVEKIIARAQARETESEQVH